MIYALTAIWYVYVYIQSDPRISRYDIGDNFVSLAKRCFEQMFIGSWQEINYFKWISSTFFYNN